MDIITTILTGILIAATSSWITVQLSMRRFRTERWWERRAKAYERVIEAFHHSKAFSDVHLKAVYTGREISEEQDKEIRARAKEAGREIERAIDLAGFFLGDEARSRLKQYQNDVANSKTAMSWHEYLEQDLTAINSCLEDLIKIAQKDLKIH